VPVSLLLEALEGVDTHGMNIHPKILEVVDYLPSAASMAGEHDTLADLSPDQEANFHRQARALLEKPGSGGPFGGPEGEGPRNTVLSEALERMAEPDEEPFSLEEETLFLKVSSHVRSALYDLLEQASTPEAAADCAARLVSLVEEDLGMGDWESFLSAWEESRKVAAAARDKRPWVEECMDKAWGSAFAPETMSHLCLMILKQGWDNSGRLVKLFDDSAAAAAGPLVDALVEEDNKSVRGVMLNLITRLSSHTLPHVLKKMSDPRWFVARNMLTILQRMGNPDAAAEARKQLTHAHPKVRVEALRTLARLDPARAINPIVVFVRDPDPDVASGAISVAGLVKDKAVADALVSLVSGGRKLRSGGREAAKRLQAVRALAFMGDPSVLPELFKVATARRLFSGADADKLKRAIFRSVESYPPGPAWNDFIQAGMKDDDPEIVDIARRLKHRLSKQELQ
ncbi:MAG: HEAT repeat domain-containing protein, partial [Deltaproteobacteria bacterium]|nr:HEAT repeat domain-containing protein [Deltaproteobacteria bacterium]